MNIFAMNYNMKYWRKDNMDNNNKNCEIDLNIWIDNNGNFKKHPSFTTFSLAKRDCPGSSLAIRELLFVLGILFLRYKFVSNEYNYKSVKEIKIRPTLTVIMDPEIGVLVEKRN